MSNQATKIVCLMSIRSINKYTVIKRFSLGKMLYDKLDTIYIQEHDSKNGEPQKVFNGKKNTLWTYHPVFTSPYAKVLSL